MKIQVHIRKNQAVAEDDIELEALSKIHVLRTLKHRGRFYGQAVLLYQAE